MNYNLSNLLFESDSDTVHNLFEEKDKEKKDPKSIVITRDNIDFKIEAQTEKFRVEIARVINSKFKESSKSKISDKPLGNLNTSSINTLGKRPITVLGKRYILEPFNAIGDLKLGASPADVKEFEDLQTIPFIVKSEETKKYLGGAKSEKEFWIDVYFMPIANTQIKGKISRGFYKGVFGVDFGNDMPFSITKFEKAGIIKLNVSEIEKLQALLKNPKQELVTLIKKSERLKGSIKENYLNSLSLLLEEDDDSGFTEEEAVEEKDIFGAIDEPVEIKTDTVVAVQQQQQDTESKPENEEDGGEAEKSAEVEEEEDNQKDTESSDDSEIKNKANIVKAFFEEYLKEYMDPDKFTDPDSNVYHKHSATVYNNKKTDEEKQLYLKTRKASFYRNHFKSLTNYNSMLSAIQSNTFDLAKFVLNCLNYRRSINFYSSNIKDSKIQDLYKSLFSKELSDSITNKIFKIADDYLKENKDYDAAHTEITGLLNSEGVTTTGENISQTTQKEANKKIVSIDLPTREEFNDAIEKLEGKINKVTGKVEDITKELDSNIKPFIESQKATNEQLENLCSGLTADISKVKNDSNKVKKIADLNKTIVEELKSQYEALSIKFTEQFAAHQTLAEKESSSEISDDVIEQLSKLKDEYNKNITDAKNIVSNYEEKLKEYLEGEDDILTQLNDHLRSIQTLEESLKDDDDIIKMIDDSLEKFKTENLDYIRRTIKDNNTSIKNINRQIKDIQKNINKQIKKVEKSVDDLKQKIEEINTERAERAKKIDDLIKQKTNEDKVKELIDAEIGILSNTIDTLKQSIPNDKTQEITNLTQLVSDLQNKTDAIIKGNKLFIDFIDNINQQINDIKYDANLVAANSSLISKNIENINYLDSELQGLFAGINKIEQNVDGLIDHYNNYIVSNKYHIDYITRTLTVKDQEIQDLKDSNNRLAQSVEEIEQQLKNKEITYEEAEQNLQVEFEDFDKQIKKLESNYYDDLYKVDKVKERVIDLIKTKYDYSLFPFSDLDGLFENYIHNKNKISEVLFESKELINEGISAKRIKSVRGELNKEELRKAYDELISNSAVENLVNHIYDELKEKFNKNKEKDLTFEKLFTHMYESKLFKAKNSLIIEDDQKEGYFDTFTLGMFSKKEKKYKKSILSYVACHILGVAINEPRQKVMKELGLDISKGYDKEKVIDQDEINDFISRLSKEEDCIAQATNEEELTNLAAAFNDFYKESSLGDNEEATISDDIKEKCDQIYSMLKDNISLLQSGRLKDSDIERFFTEKRVVKMIQDLLSGREVDQLKEKKPLEKFNKEQEELIENLCIYYTMQYRKEEVENLDKRKMHSKEGKAAKPWLTGTAVAATTATIATVAATGGLAFFVPLLVGAATGAGGLSLGIGAAASALDDWKADENNITNSARDLCKEDIKSLKSAILKINKEVLLETFIFKKGISLLIEQEDKTGNKYNIERDTLEKILRARGVLGYKTDNSDLQSVTIGRIASLLDSEFGITVSDVDLNVSYEPQNVAIEATTNKNAPVGKGANNNLEKLFKGMIPGMSGDLINNPLTLMMMMNRGGGDMASMMLTLMMMQNGTFENLLNNVSKKGVTVPEAAKEIKKAGSEVGVSATKNLVTALNDAAKSIDRDKPYFRKNEIALIIKEVRKHIDFLHEFFYVDKQKIKNDLDVVSHYVKPYVNIVSNDKEIKDRTVWDILKLLNAFTNHNLDISFKIIDKIVSYDGQKIIKDNDFEGLRQAIKENNKDKDYNLDQNPGFGQHVFLSQQKFESRNIEIFDEEGSLNISGDGVKEIITDYNNAYDEFIKKPQVKKKTTTQSKTKKKTTTQDINSSFIRGKLSDLLFEEVDIIKGIREEKTITLDLKREMYRIWNIKK